MNRWTVRTLGSALAAFALNADAASPPDAATLGAIAAEIEALKPTFPQLREFSAARNANAERLAISYAYRTHRPAPTGGWTSGVPAPDDDGLWFHLDFHDPDSKAELHSQPMTVRPQCLGTMRVGFLLREGANTASVNLALWQVLRRHGVVDCASRN